LEFGVPGWCDSGAFGISFCQIKTRLLFLRALCASVVKSEGIGGMTANQESLAEAAKAITKDIAGSTLIFDSYDVERNSLWRHPN